MRGKKEWRRVERGERRETSMMVNSSCAFERRRVGAKTMARLEEGILLASFAWEERKGKGRKWVRKSLK